MKNIIKRNKFTILLGLILSIVFVVIIVLSQNEDSEFTLKPAKKNEDFEITTERPDQENQPFDNSEENKTNETDSNNISGSNQANNGVLDSSSNVEKPADRVDEIISNMEPVRISFNEEGGFIPIDETAIEDQRLVWVNNTNRIIEIKQTIQKYDNLPETIKIGSGQTYSMQLTEPKNWGYKELISEHTGTIFVYPKK